MFYTIYKITNQIDGKFYIGSHKTKDLNDVYMGSGKYLIHAQKKYGIDNFKKEILFVFETTDEMYAKEAEIVNEDFLATENTYNLKIGGFGGWDYINNSGLSRLNEIRDDQWIAQKIKAGKNGFASVLENGKGYFSGEAKLKATEKREEKYPNGTFSGKTHTVETKLKMSESAKATSRGERNSQYGTRWIHSLDEKKSKKIEKDATLPEGWLEGRKMKF